MMTSVFTEIKTTGENKNLTIKLEKAESEIISLKDENEKLLEKIEKNKIAGAGDYENKIAVLETKLTEANNKIKDLEAELKNIGNSTDENKYGSDTDTVIATSTEQIWLDDDCVSNIIKAIQLLDGSVIKASSNFSVYSKIGTYSGRGYVTGISGLWDSTYADGVEYLIDMVYRTGLRAGLQMDDPSILYNGKVYVDDSNNLNIRNNTDKDITIQCGFHNGVMTVSFVVK